MRSDCFSRSYLAIESIPNHWVDTLQFLVWLRRPKLSLASTWPSQSLTRFDESSFPSHTFSHSMKGSGDQKHSAESWRFSSFSYVAISEGPWVEFQAVRRKCNTWHSNPRVLRTFISASHRRTQTPHFICTEDPDCAMLRLFCAERWGAILKNFWDQICTPLNLASLAHVCYPVIFADIVKQPP